MTAVLIAPAAKADSVNLAPFPANWVTDTPWGYQVPDATYGIYQDQTYTTGGDYTLRIDPTSADPVGAFDHVSIPVNPGYQVFISCWVKTAGSYAGDYQGARIGIDWYGAGAGWTDIGGVDPSQYYATGELSGTTYDGYVHWGTDWTQVTYNFAVPSYIVAQAGYSTDYTVGQHVTPTAFIPWCQVWSSNYPTNAYSAWWRDMVINVDPPGSSASTPTPTPTAAPTATPGGGSGGGGGGGWSVVNPTPGPTAAASPGGGINLSAVAAAWNGISGGGKLFLILALGVGAFFFAGKKH